MTARKWAHSLVGVVARVRGRHVERVGHEHGGQAGARARVPQRHPLDVEHRGAARQLQAHVLARVRAERLQATNAQSLLYILLFLKKR